MSFGGPRNIFEANMVPIGESQFSFQQQQQQTQQMHNQYSKQNSLHDTASKDLHDYLNIPGTQQSQPIANQAAAIANELDEEMRRARLANELRQINDALMSYGYNSLGNLFDTSSDSIEQTVYGIRSLLQQRQRDLEFRQLHHETLKRDQHDIAQMYASIEKLQAKNKVLQSEVDVQTLKFKNCERELRDEKERLSAQVRDLNLSYAKIVNRETQFNNEFRKKDAQIKQYQDQMKKYQAQEKSIVYQNNFEITSRLDKVGPSTFNAPVSADLEFAQQVYRDAQEVNSRISAENQLLRESLAQLHTELNEMINVRRDLFVRRVRMESADESMIQQSQSLIQDFAMLPFKKELFAMPLEPIGKEAIDVLAENLKRFKEAMNKIDNVQREYDANFEGEPDKDIEKIACLKNLKNLLKNYKYVVETQDTLINKAIVKSKNLDNVNEAAFSVSRFNKVLDDQEIENAKAYLIDQKRFLEEKQFEMEKTKNMMSMTVTKLSEAKNSMKQRRQELEKDAMSFKENINSIVNNQLGMFDEQYRQGFDGADNSLTYSASKAPQFTSTGQQKGALFPSNQNIIFSEYSRDEMAN